MANTISSIVSDDTLSRIIQIESAGNPLAKARTSSALGIAQFIEKTWLDVISRHRPDLMRSRNRNDVLRLRTDPILAIEMLGRLTEDNVAMLGGPVSDGDVYLAHFAGVGTAKRIINSGASVLVSSVMSRAAVEANGSILRGKTCAEVRAWAAKKMSAAGGRDWIGKWYLTENMKHHVEESLQQRQQTSGEAEGANVRQPVTAIVFFLLMALLVAAFIFIRQIP
ncbi:hypothetical protein X566_17990 [Afipia sp. P52-10]|uniref:transglycosylase SLT domain-containing protein n=1 Tax=Afipia sp. P52-10 TaxID=1429916 RepID=UPI0003DF1D2E|nr:transglycosylase SLT domain-containing protein [Afipia sp. P52-10]ETR75852.1 hypothetical protein X566_17990 [Afipia sp. P52-10]